MDIERVISNIDATPNHLKFVWSNVDLAIMHSIQRVMVSELNTLAIDLVMIDDNTSVLSDEQLALRLGLIPMQSMTADTFLLPDECDCESYCNKCSIQMSLNVVCYEDRYDVTSKDLFWQDPRTRPIHESGLPAKYLGEDGYGPGILITTLIKNQQIKLSCIIRKGTGKIHSKWNPCSTAVFRPAPKVSLNSEMISEMISSGESTDKERLERLMECCPRSVFGTDIEDIIENTSQRNDLCINCKACVQEAEKMDRSKMVNVGFDDRRMLCEVEGIGMLQPKEMILKGIDVLCDKFVEFENQLRALSQV